MQSTISNRLQAIKVGGVELRLEPKMFVIKLEGPGMGLGLEPRLSHQSSPDEDTQNNWAMN